MGHRRAGSGANDETYSKHTSREERKTGLDLSRREDGSLQKTRFDDAGKSTAADSRSRTSAFSARDINSTHGSYPRRNPDATEVGILDARSSAKLLEQVDSAPQTTNPPKGNSAPHAVPNISRETIQDEVEATPNSSLDYASPPKSILANVDAELERRAVSTEEANVINSIWDRRVRYVCSFYALRLR